ncbi:MAG: transcription-repair coupling factor [Clostridia bacterium]
MQDFLKLNKLGGDFYNLLIAVRSGKPTTAFSLASGAKIHVSAALEMPALYITSDRLAAAEVFDKFKGFVGDRCVLIAEKDDVLLHRAAFSIENIAKRIEALTKLVSGQADIAIISAEALLQYFPNIDTFKSKLIALEVDKEYELSNLIEKLISSGYFRSELAADKGTFSLRGDILDIFPLSFEKPIRINFFDNLIETIKYFDCESMESLENISNVIIPPSSDILLTEKEVSDISNKLTNINASGHIKEIIDDISEKLSINPNDSTLIWLTPFMENLSTIFDYLPRGSAVIFDEPKLLNDKLDLIEKEHLSRVKSLTEGNSALEIHKKSLIKKTMAYTYAKIFKRLAYQQITALNPIFESAAIFTFRSQPLTKYYLDNIALVADLKNFLYNQYRVVLCCSDERRAKTVADNLKQNDVMVYETDIVSSGICATTLDIRTGFIYHSAKLVVLGTDELFGRGRLRIGAIKPKKGFIQLKAGDYVVHSVHGIGICEGTDKLKTDTIEKDYVVLRYRDGDKLYVPIDQMDMLTKFTGGETPRLNKIGGKEFAKTKERVKLSVKKLAIDLLELYSQREKQKGFKYSADTIWQKEFEDKFEFDLTDDQVSAVSDIKSDMEKGRLMDRLICGDVGYGKTEVAFRAIFKTIMDGKQAAILAPTTILAKQHFNTLCSRLDGFGINVKLLSRFQSTAEIKSALEGLQLGTVSIVVATHRLLSKDIVFNDLGLLVLDEEQRFGVEHKEKLKAIKKDVNILTLTATPIPRTLNLALSGIRDISLLETPPQNRLPVQNYIVEYTDTLLKDALTRELNRGGQAFILYNYVETIEEFAIKVRELLGGQARIIVAHGQMANKELDLKMTAFYQREADVLIATTIIENGIDLPDANTLIIYDADRFGLSQLYQLRGRVGRSGVLAHAYFTTRLGKVLSEPAVKRLTALTEYAEFGSGFKIALRDLEIRGAGSFLGAEQHGHIEKVGYDMYSKLLAETVSELKSGYTAEQKDVEIKIDCNAYISESYVSSGDKIRIYKRISEVTSVVERDELISTLTDIYGVPSQPLVNLISIALIKSMAKRYEVDKIILNNKGAGFMFNSADVFKQEGLLRAVAKMDKNVVLTASIPPQLLFNTKGRSAEEVLALMLNFLQCADGFFN